MTLPFAGVVVVWSADKPRLETLRIGDGLVFGREHADPADDRISRLHAEITVVDDRIVVDDRQSRNGTYVNGEQVVNRSVRPTLPAIMRTGATVSVLVPDVRPYEHVPISRRGSLVVAGSLDGPVRMIERAALDEENVLIIGALSIGHELALGYARTVGGKYIVIDTGAPMSINRVLENDEPARTVILLLGRTPLDTEWQTLADWLETDVRFVTVLRTEAQANGMPVDQIRRLGACMVTIPRMRFDELPTTLHELVKSRAPHAHIHASAVEAALLRARDTDEDGLLDDVRDAIDAWATSGETVFRDDHLIHQTRTSDLRRVMYLNPRRR